MNAIWRDRLQRRRDAPTEPRLRAPAAGRALPRAAARPSNRTSRSRSRPSPTCGRAGSPAGSRSAASTSAITGCSAIAGASRSLRSLPAQSIKLRDRSPACPRRTVDAGAVLSPAERPKRREHVPGRDRHAGIDQHGGHLRQDRADRTGSRRCRASRAAADRGRPARRRRSRGRRHQAADRRAQCRWRAPAAASAAAASAEPPPSPAATGSCFDSAKRPSLQPLDPLGKRAGGLEHEIVGGLAGGRRGRAVDGRASSAPPGANVNASPMPANTTRLSSHDSRRRDGRARAASD